MLKQKETNLERYGVSNPMQLDSVKTKAKETSVEKFGKTHYSQTDEYKDKVRTSNVNKYGVEHTFQREDVKSKISHSKEKLDKDEINAKRVATVQSKYNTDNVAQAETVKEKTKQTNLERYGVETTFLNPEIDAKRRATWDANYGEGVHPLNALSVQSKREGSLYESLGVTVPFSSAEVRDKAKTTMLQRYGAEYALQVPEFLDKQILTTNQRIQEGLIQPSKISKINKNFAQDLQDKYGVSVEFEKTVDGASFDLFVPERNLYVDLNPAVSHNSLVPFACMKNSCGPDCVKHSPVASTYHYNRAKIALNNDISLVQIYDWDDNIHRFLHGKLANNFTKLSAKKLSLVRISQKDANEFLSIYHIQGKTKQQTHCYGLLLGDEILAVATFGPSRFNKNYDYEFIRYAVKTGHIVHGASARLFKAFVKDMSSSAKTPVSVVSYVDFDHTTRQHTFLNTLGFVEQPPTSPSLVWFNVQKQHKVNNLSVTTIGADRILGTQYGSIEESGLNNKGIMLEEGYLPVYTSGNRIFVWQE